jgi:hypothetical protein
VQGSALAQDAAQEPAGMTPGTRWMAGEQICLDVSGNVR